MNTSDIPNIISSTYTFFPVKVSLPIPVFSPLCPCFFTSLYLMLDSSVMTLFCYAMCRHFSPRFLTGVPLAFLKFSHPLCSNSPSPPAMSPLSCVMCMLWNVCCHLSALPGLVMLDDFPDVSSGHLFVHQGVFWTGRGPGVHGELHLFTGGKVRTELCVAPAPTIALLPLPRPLSATLRTCCPTRVFHAPLTLTLCPGLSQFSSL